MGFKEFLEKSEELRNGYTSRLAPADKIFREKWSKHFSELPELFEEIYGNCNGTVREIEEQMFFDFLPGYRLMQIDDIIEIYESDLKNRPEFDIVIPFLADYSGCYYAYAKEGGRECVVLIADGDLEEIHSTVDDFWKTVLAFYDEGVYFLDEDGYLDYDFEKEAEIGEKFNPGISYWSED